MYYVKIKDKFIKEEYAYSSDCGIYLIEDISEATRYKSIYELLIALRYVKNGSGTFRNKNLLNRKDIEKIELINSKTLKTISFNYIKLIKAVEKYNKENLFLNKEDFLLYINCFVSSSHWTYDNENKWIAFPKGDDYEKITKIRYYKRGLMHIVSSIFHYRNASIPGCYSFFKDRKCLMNDVLYKIALNNEEDCSNYYLFMTNK